MRLRHPIWGKWLVGGSHVTQLFCCLGFEINAICTFYRFEGRKPQCYVFNLIPARGEDVIMSGDDSHHLEVFHEPASRRCRLQRQDSVLNLKFDKRYLVTCSKTS